MNGFLPPVLAAAVAYTLNVLLMVTALSLVALVVARSALRRDAAARYLLCLAALVCILLAPLIVGTLRDARFGAVVYAVPAATTSHSSLAVVTASPGSPAAAEPPRSQVSVWQGFVPLLLLIWAAGMTYGVVRFMWGWRTVARLRRTVHPLDAAALGSALEHIQQTLGALVPPILASERVISPVAIGLLHPVVILPEGLAEELTPVQLRHVLLHECAHVAFRHACGGVVQQLVALLYWPHPLIAVLCRELAWAREEICDNVALQEDGAACYARTLLTIAQGLSTAPQPTSALALLGQETSLERRINGLLDPRRNRMVGVKRGKLWAVTGCVALTMILAAAVRVIADDTKASQETEQQRAAQAQLDRARQAMAIAKQAFARQAVNRLNQPLGSSTGATTAQPAHRSVAATNATDNPVFIVANGQLTSLVPVDKLTNELRANTIVDLQTGTTSHYMVPAASAKSTSAPSTKAVRSVASPQGKTSPGTTGTSASSSTNGKVSVVSANGRWHVVNTKDTSSGGK